MIVRTKGVIVGGVVILMLGIAPALGDVAVASVPTFCQTAKAENVFPAPSERTGIVLAANKKFVLAGTRIFARFVNFSSAKASYGREFQIEKYAAGAWTIDESSPDGPWPRSSHVLDSRAAGSCYQFNAPADLQPGRYRFSARIAVRGEPAPVAFRRFAEFAVQYVGASASTKLPVLCQGDRVPATYLGKVVLASNSNSAVPGGSVYTRLFNGLDRPVGLGTRYVQKYVDGQWTTFPPSTPNGKEPIYPHPSRRILPSKSAGQCRSFTVDAERLPGRYRVVNEVYFDLRSGAKPSKRTVEYRVGQSS